MINEKATIESLIKGGLIGAVFGAFLSKDKEEGAVIGALLGAAISATIKANEAAKKTNVPIYVEENGKLYEISSFGEKRFVKNIKKPSQGLPDSFKLQ
jgi:gas vesicle protein